MTLTNNDLKQIRGVVREEVGEAVSAAESRINKNVDQKISTAEQRINKNVDQKISTAEQRINKNVDQKIESAKQEIISKVNREISDLAAINQAVIAKVSVIPELQQRIIRIEQHLELEPIKS